MVLFTDQYANIDGGTAPFINLPMCENDETLMPELPPGRTSGEIGSGENTLVYANHIHPFDGACFNDTDFTALEKQAEACNQAIQQEIEKRKYTLFVAGSKFLVFISDICTAILISGVPFAAMFINFILWTLESMYGLGIKDIDINGVTEDVLKVRDMIMEKYQ